MSDDDPTDPTGTTLDDQLVDCPVCRGTARAPGDELVRANGCYFCAGGRRVSLARAAEYQRVSVPDVDAVACPACEATGAPSSEDVDAASPFVGGAACGVCFGTKRVTSAQAVAFLDRHPERATK